MHRCGSSPFERRDVIEFALHQIKPLHDVVCGLEHHAAGIGQNDLASRSVEKFRPQRLFESGDMSAHGGLRNAKLPGGPSKTSETRNGNEGSQVIENDHE